MRRTRLNAGGLDAWILEPEEPRARPDLNVLLCHGYGAPGDDLVALAPELAERDHQIATRCRWIFPEAPHSLEEMGNPWGRAWWHLDIERLLSGRDWKTFVEEVPEGLPRVRRMLLALLEYVAARTNVPFSRTVLGGFSQGAMLTTDLALRLEEAPAGLVILSGTLLSRGEWAELIARRTNLPVFQSHGRMDPLLPFEVAESLRRLFEDAGAKVAFVPFHAQHTIAPEVLQGLASWLKERLGPSNPPARGP
jgi:phospholipase/carboxylesterase